MILQALVKAYEALAERGELEKPGWVEVKVSYALELDGQGKLLQVFPLGLPNSKGKRTARPMKLPEMVKRSSGVAANFLCDNAIYMLGLNLKDKKDRALKCYAACAELNTRLLQGVEHPMARAICRFFETWDAERAEEHPLIAPIRAELKAGGNLIFSMDSTFAQEVPEIRAAWDRHYGDRADAPRGRCLVTGEEGPIALLHPSIKGVPGAHPTGASLSMARITSPTSRSGGFLSLLFWFVVSPSIIHRESSSRSSKAGRTISSRFWCSCRFSTKPRKLFCRKKRTDRREALGARPRI